MLFRVNVSPLPVMAVHLPLPGGGPEEERAGRRGHRAAKPRALLKTRSTGASPVQETYSRLRQVPGLAVFYGGSGWSEPLAQAQGRKNGTAARRLQLRRAPGSAPRGVAGFPS